MSSDGRQTTRVAIYGGSFNPPHVGHVLAACYVLSTCDVDEVLVVPTFQHPFAKELASFDDRFALCEAAFAQLPGARVSRVEADLGGESRTLRTLEHLAAAHPDWEMRLMIGADILGDAPKWHGFDRVRELAPLIVLGRAGVARPDAPEPVLPRVSSTSIRELLANGRGDELAPLVPRAVLAEIERRRLYRRGTP